MKLEFTKSFVRDYRKLPQHLQEQTDRKLTLLLANQKHPSLRVHKIKKTTDILEGSVTMNYRFTFQIEADRYILRRIGTHDIIKTP
ncbi:MAG: hypothetical protein A3E05_01765 [Candidatus Jacksonbacteria bacterium RIFCSPHIGHO2_12_FULL_44_12]|nr:MAG: hypothetical protein A3E05_01765 [Candidatus Jacksonbacteria bacterium RIFCSPHIGHO2_12_FULL_44_12]